jgi:DNA-binding protein Fis
MEEKERLTVSTISRSEEIEDKNYCNKLKENLEKYFTI